MVEQVLQLNKVTEDGPKGIVATEDTANMTLGGLGGLTDTTQDDGIPFKTETYSMPLGTTGKFYGTGIDPSQRFIFTRLKLDSQGDPIKMFEKWETFDESDKKFIADMDQRRDELTPDEIDTLDALKMVAGDAIKPYLSEAAQKYAFATAAEKGGETALARLGLDPFNLDASQVDKAKLSLAAGDSPTSYALKEASPFHSSAYGMQQDIAAKAPTGYSYNPDVEAAFNTGKLPNNPGQFARVGDNIYYSNVAPPTLPSSFASSSYNVGPPSMGSSGYGMKTNITAPTPNVAAGTVTPEPSFWSADAFSDRASEAFSPTTVASNFAVSFGVNLITGSGKPKERIEQAADTAIGSTIGSAIGTAIGGPIGGFIGSTIGSVVGGGGRVICNELMRQKLLSREDVILDYKFTKDYLTPTHVKGYHVWAIWMVKQMRKGRFVKFWRHIAKHRANEIAYIYGKKKNPDYLGKIYRKIGEPICWVIGLFCEQSDWSILYKEKKIGN